MVDDFQVLLEAFAVDAPFDEHVIALECLLEAMELLIEVRGRSIELEELRSRAKEILQRAA